MDIFIAHPNDLDRIKTYLIRPYSIQEKIRKVKYFGIDERRESFYSKDGNSIRYDDKVIQLLKGNDDLSKVDANYLLIQNNANWESNLSGTQIILDGSNFLQDDLSSTNVWQTRIKGAFLIPVK